MSSGDNLPDIALANVALENLNEKGENKIKNIMSVITNELNKNITDNYNTLNDKIIKDVGDLDTELTKQITDLSTSTNNDLKTKADVNLSNLTDAGNTVIDGRITAIMNTTIKQGTGYFFSGKTLVQYGTVSGGTTVTFPKPFSIIPKVIVSQSDGTTHETNVGCSSKTTTGFYNVRYGCDWIALGT